LSDDERWQSAGISRDARSSFEEWKIDVNAAIKWHRAGVSDGLTATRWQIAGVAPAEVARWQAAGIESIEALQWYQHGYGLDAAKQEKARGIDPFQAQPQGHQQSQLRRPPSGSGRTTQAWAMASSSGMQGPNGETASPAFEEWFAEHGHQGQTARFYLMAGWMSDEALPWAKADIPPEAARTWSLLGLRPSEAARLERAEVKASEVVREWWGAGIPLDQVAAWLGAGLTAAEAAAQIAAGVTPDQAGVMRALRDEDYED
jgi:hypothetical protein